MVQVIDNFIEKQVQVMTCEGRIYQGTLKSFDQRTNVILGDCQEHLFKGDQIPMEKEEMGAFLIRGDNIAVIAEVEANQFNSDQQVCANPIPPMQL